MRLTVIPEDGTVSVDNVAHTELTLVNIPDNVNALQWYHNEGEIEYNGYEEKITELPDWALKAIDVYNIANTPPTYTEEELAQIAIQETNEASLQYLQETDWYVIRYEETGVPVPQEILDARAEARASIVHI
jgi:hypothetical protein